MSLVIAAEKSTRQLDGVDAFPWTQLPPPVGVRAWYSADWNSTTCEATQFGGRVVSSCPAFCGTARALTSSEAARTRIPTMRKTSPTLAKVRITQNGVRIGCQALSRCCLKSESGSIEARAVCQCHAAVLTLHDDKRAVGQHPWPRNSN